MYHNYHKHSHKGNIGVQDSIAKAQDYINRAIELGHTTVFSTEHGFHGDVFELKDLIDKKNKELDDDKKLKMIIGCEFYYVDDISEKERYNNHLVVIALNDNGYRQINKAVTIAYREGFYYRPRIDKKILFEIFNPKDVVITTACVAGILSREDSEKIVKEFHEHFKNHFFLEVQNHNEEKQKIINKLAIAYRDKFDIKLIHANDSHYIYPQDSYYRDMYLKGKGINYPDESTFILDYPNEETIIERYKKQNILSDDLIKEALDSTLIFDTAEEITMINYEIKLPSISKNSKQEFEDIVNKEWENTLPTVNKEKISEYINAIEFEKNIVHETNMEDYFIIDYKIVDRAINKYGGYLTKTGRGSAVSFYINKLLGFTEVDRMKAPVPLYPTRFMSKTRILQTRSLPDIDLNVIAQEPFIKATEDLLGKENCAWMLSYKPLQDSSAFRLWCKALGMENDDYNEVAKNLDNYRDDKEWVDIIEESKHFIGVVESVSPSPCSMLLYDKPVNEEIGIIRTKEGYCCLLDKNYCDKYKYLKNDYLVVNVWEIIKSTCDLVGIEVPTIDGLEKILDDKTWGIYEKGLTCTINQADSDWATELVSKYKPKTVAELCAFIAGIRPGFASLLKNFIDRKPYSTGVEELDELLKESYHYMMYQESIMKYLVWLGIPEDETYGIIKKISKKNFTQEEINNLKETLLNNWITHVGTEEGFLDTWQVIEDAVRYAFNSAHSLSYTYDSLFGAYLKSHYPLEYYTVVLNKYGNDKNRTPRLVNECKQFGIKLQSPKFGYSKAEYFFNKETNTIYKGVGSIKYLNEQKANILYELSQSKNYETFTDILYDAKEIDNRCLEILIKLGYFSEFGSISKLLKVFELYKSKGNKKTMSKTKDIELYMTYKELAEKNATKETAKVLNMDYHSFIRDVELSLEDVEDDVIELIKNEIEYTGGFNKVAYKQMDKNACFISDLKIFKYNIEVELFCFYSGNAKIFKMDKQLYNQCPFVMGEVLYLYGFIPKKRKKNNIVDYYITDFEVA